MKWRNYDGARIPTAGKRTFVEDPPTMQFAEPIRRHGYAWKADGQFWGMLELLRPGEIDDVVLGPFSVEREARRAVEGTLLGAS